MTKRQQEGAPLGDALKAFIQEHKLQKGIDRVAVRTAWAERMGNGVNAYTQAVELQGDTLFVSLSSSVLREELSHGRSKIVAMLNEALGKELIKKLVLR